MVFFEWKDEYETGLPDIDLQHTMIVNMLNQLYVAMESGSDQSATGKILSKLLLYVEEHFTTEEQAMRDNGFTGIAEHLLEHERFRDKVELMHARHQRGIAVRSSELVFMLMDWLKSHIAETDQDFGTFVQSLSEKARREFFQ